MIDKASYLIESWSIQESGLDISDLGRSESLFALSNGHIGLRGNLDEGDPHGLPGTYLNSVHELRPLPYAEAGYGYPESGQTVINVTNGKVIRLLVDDEPFDIRYGDLRSHQRAIDFREGVLRRDVEWVSPAGQTIRVHSERLVSFSQRSIAAVYYEIEPVGDPARVVIQSELVANEQLPAWHGDPRAASALESPLRSERHRASGTMVELVHITHRSEIRVAAAMDHEFAGPDSLGVSSESEPDAGRVTATAVLAPGEKLRMVKFIAYGWSEQRSLPALRDQAAAALVAARQTGWPGLVAEQRQYLDAFWKRADVEVDGDPEVQQAVRFALFHVLQAGSRAERRAIPAKGLTGPGYDGHAFWDSESYVLPVLTYTAPDAAADALRWRYATLPLARERADLLNLKGAVFPWRTIHGEECSGYWPAGTAAFHVNADIADAVARYVTITGDERFERTVGLEILIETARLWRSLGHHDLDGRFRIDGVTGPDEYSAIADNNVYTNLMAQRNLVAAADAARRHPDRAAELGVDAEVTASWRDAAENMFIPYDPHLGVHPQSEGFTEHQVWDFANTAPEQYPLLLHFPYFDLYRKQVIKQADLVLAMQRRGDAFTMDEKIRNFAYYEALTVRDSSLSACSQAVLAAECGHLSLAHDYLREAALMDLHDIEHNTGDGLHMASLAGSWIALVEGFGGLRDGGEVISFAPRLPEGLTRLAFGLCVRGRHLRVEVSDSTAVYTVPAGPAMTLLHHGKTVRVVPGQPVSMEVPPTPVLERPKQPSGREPLRFLRLPGTGGRIGPTGPSGSVNSIDG
ncbi:trehalose/maltose hydrolase or phosphorylase [Frankia casuarinae]|uniref:Glycoside hydrolase family 65, central catalytic n=2 Tax=Frankia casuarinae (strain DSM 45818 / CECT 9043 / HFP020203 / CcI3) TaxID=106370 RepID=Q2J4U9_FRACC|nr:MULTISPECIES: glycosyl hydrolase family 65 protein [Frankia]ABD13693.1 glycoside hydrolase family 65, central catalytic [Frankia casuarinae]ETA02721.1 trehalose/maltose hydrolase or phosphorylase [Frankia sp. CcI6]EYT93107.1 trehalose/maltose hydrolase or phosphorylase [Frankia casuarinae]KDA43197.1 trehalose/maltose hydrolase or phosphorylase [Frankia sp. BMG5.23]KFB07063.1 trehalose/maltose hydrolase or phosphorylase [Frankia sp. Allo2]